MSDSTGEKIQISDQKNLDNDRKIMPRREFFRRILIVVSVVTTTVIVLFLLWQSMEVILLVFGGILFGILLRSLAKLISDHTPLSINLSVIIILIALVGSIFLGFSFLAPSFQKHWDDVSRQVPEIVSLLRERIEQYQIGRWISEGIPQSLSEMKVSPSNVFGRITGFFSSFFGVLVNAAIVLVTGIYFAFNPELYYEGVIKIFPKNRHPRVREVMDTLAFNLQRSIIGRISVMAINGFLTAVGLWLLGVPLAVPLGITTALLNFIPNLGPFLAAIPAVLVGFTQSTETALYVFILFIFIQNLEGFILTPLVQQKAVSLPPVLVISAQLLMGILFGFIGVLLAEPLAAVIFILVKMIYVEDILGNYVEVKGEKEAKAN